MSVEAMSWALNDAPLEDARGKQLPQLLGVLIGLANHADASGRGAFPSQTLLSKYARKGARAVRDDLAKLLELKLIKPGDQRMVAHLPADRRPVVYDLAIDRKRSTGGSVVPPGAVDPGGPVVPAGTVDPHGTVEQDGRVCGSATGGSVVPTNHPLNHPEPPSPPAPHDAPPADAAPEAETVGGGEDQGEDQPEPGNDSDLAALVAEIRAERPEWTTAAIRSALVEPSVLERPWPIRVVAMRLIAADPQSTSPGRLRAPGPWWAKAAAVVRARDRPAERPSGAEVRRLRDISTRAVKDDDKRAERMAAVRSQVRKPGRPAAARTA